MGRELDGAAWSLGSSNGYARVVCTSAVEAADHPFRVRLEYQLPSEPHPTATADVSNFGLRRAAIADLIAAISDFVDQPLREIDPTDFVYKAELAEGAGDRLDLSFGPRADVVTGSDGVACSVELGRSALHACIVFRTDVTWLERCAAELDRVLLVL
jgi:hypothetical protein